ncbi:MAG: hypothetical protein IKH11_01400 [Bacteroidales bacterium]|nr:hypothetical protein [Bacteroidales bacterium]
MKKYIAISFAAVALLAISCKKEVAPEASVPQDMSAATIEKTFTVKAPESDTKTEMNGSAKVVWSKGDQITVIAKTSGNLATFTLTEGDGTASAKFSGKIAAADAEETVFYAFYPASIEIDPFDANRPLSGGNITVKADCFPSREIPAVKDGFSAEHAMMVGAIDADGNIAFHFGTAFFKIKISEAGIKSILFESSGSARFSGRPSWSTSNFSTVDVQSAKNFVTLTANPALEKDAVYYVPVQTKQSNVKTLTLTFTTTDGYVATASTTSLNSVTLQNGIVYDLNCPPVDFTPVILSSDVSIGADATSGSIAYEISNSRADGVLTAALKEASDWLTVGDVSEDDVALTATANTGYARNATVTLTYTYDGNKTVTKDVIVNQGAGSDAGETHTHIFYVDSSKKSQILTDNATGSYFTTAGGTADLGGDYNISNWTINGITSTKGWKMNSNGEISFTTSSTLISSVRFWFIRRKTGDTAASIQIIPEGGSETVISSPYEAPGDSGDIALEKGTKYTIKQKSKEQALLLVIVTEVE